MGNISKIISNTFYLFLDWAVLTVGGYLYWVAMGKLLSPAEVGRFSTIFNIAMFFVGFAGLGMNIAITKLFPSYQKGGQKKRIIGTFWWVIRTTLLSSILFGVFLVILYFLLPKPLMIGFSDVLMIIFMILTTNLLYATNGYFYGIQNFRLVFLSDTILAASKIAVMLPFVVLGYGYLGPIYGFLSASLLTLAVRARSIPAGSGPVDKRALWFYSVSVLTSMAGVMLINQGNIVILSLFSTASTVGLFSLMFFLSSPMRIIPQLISSSIFPVTSAQADSDNKDSVNRIFFHGTRYALVLTVPLLAVFVLFSNQLVLMLSSPQYLEAAYIVPIIAVAYLSVGLATIFINTLYATGHVNESRDSQLLGGAVNLAFSVWLIPAYGLTGASLAFLACGISMLMYSIVKVKACLNLNFPVRDSLRTILAGAAFYASALYSHQFFGGGWWLISATLGAAVYFFSLAMLKFFKKTDVRILGDIRDRFPRSTQKIFGRFVAAISHFAT